MLLASFLRSDGEIFFFYEILVPENLTIIPIFLKKLTIRNT
jgi:hypothetical protein